MGGRNKQLALLAAIMGSFVAGLDATAVNVALPAIRADLGGGLAGQQWVSNAYLLALGSLILVGGSLGDLFGERRVFSLGVAGFGAVSVLCARRAEHRAARRRARAAGRVRRAPHPERAGAHHRGLPGLGAGRRDRVVDGLVGHRDRDRPARRRLPRRCGLVAADLRDQRPVRRAHARAHPRVRCRRASAAARARGSTGRAPLLTFLGLAGPVLALIRQPVVGWGSPQVWAPGLAGIVLLAAFLAHERRTPAPMLPLGLFRRRNFAVGNLQTFAMYGGLSVTFFFLVLFLQQVAGYDALEAGLAVMPATLVMFALSKRIGKLADRVGPRLFMGLRPAHGRRRPGADAAHRRRPQLRDRSPAGAARLRGRPGADRRAAHRDRARRCRRVQRGHRVGHQQRDRARGGAARRGGHRRGRLGAVQLCARRAAGGARPLAGRLGRGRAGARPDARPRSSPASRGPRSPTRCAQPPTTPSTSASASRPRSSRSAACSASQASGTRGAACAARTAPAASSPASRSTRRASGRRSQRYRSRPWPERHQIVSRWRPPGPEDDHASCWKMGV